MEATRPSFCVHLLTEMRFVWPQEKYLEDRFPAWPLFLKSGLFRGMRMGMEKVEGKLPRRDDALMRKWVAWEECSSPDRLVSSLYTCYLCSLKCFSLGYSCDFLL